MPLHLIFSFVFGKPLAKGDQLAGQDLVFKKVLIYKIFAKQKKENNSKRPFLSQKTRTTSYFCRLLRAPSFVTFAFEETPVLFAETLVLDLAEESGQISV